MHRRECSFVNEVIFRFVTSIQKIETRQITDSQSPSGNNDVSWLSSLKLSASIRHMTDDETPQSRTDW